MTGSELYWGLKEVRRWDGRYNLTPPAIEVAGRERGGGWASHPNHKGWCMPWINFALK